mmetsp:Transcript_1602/g.3672  ORF Transcript_1602/g.3672 Transcript_1602/m.3672 type:complete len:275 (-) Transcript_1602:849-1673(-)
MLQRIAGAIRSDELPLQLTGPQQMVQDCLVSSVEWQVRERPHIQRHEVVYEYPRLERPVGQLVVGDLGVEEGAVMNVGDLRESAVDRRPPERPDASVVHVRVGLDLARIGERRPAAERGKVRGVAALDGAADLGVDGGAVLALGVLVDLRHHRARAEDLPALRRRFVVSSGGHLVLSLVVVDGHFVPADTTGGRAGEPGEPHVYPRYAEAPVDEVEAVFHCEAEGARAVCLPRQAIRVLAGEVHVRFEERDGLRARERDVESGRGQLAGQRPYF